MRHSQRNDIYDKAKKGTGREGEKEEDIWKPECLGNSPILGLAELGAHLRSST